MKIIKPPKRFTFECDECLAIIEFDWTEMDEFGNGCCEACGSYNEVNEFEAVEDD